MIITIDGPAVSGKSTVARMLAQSLGFYYLNTGLLFRALAYALLHDKKYSVHMLHAPNKDDIKYCLDITRLVYEYKNNKAAVFYLGQDITFRCKDSDMSEYASFIALNAYVQDCIMQYQREVAHSKSVVCEGRNVGSEVFPDADVKFYVSASVGIRAHRLIQFERYKGYDLSIDDAQRLVQERDHRDMTRLHAPLIKPIDAIEIDSSSISAPEVVEKMKTYINSLKKN